MRANPIVSLVFHFVTVVVLGGYRFSIMRESVIFCFVIASKISNYP